MTWAWSVEFYKFLSESGRFFAVDNPDRLIVSENKGFSWSEYRVSLVDFDWFAGRLVAISAYGVPKQSFDFGRTWAPMGTSGFTITHEFSLSLDAIAGNGENLFVFGEYDGFYASTDSGKSWIRKDSLSRLPNIGFQKKLFGIGNNLFVASDTLFMSTDGGWTWTPILDSLPDTRASPILEYSGELFAVSRKRILRSPDSGATWLPADTGISHAKSTSLAVMGGWLLAGTENAGIFRLDSQGSRWIPVNTDRRKESILSLTRQGSALYANSESRIFRSLDAGKSWSLVSTNDFPHSTLVATGQDLFMTSNTDLRTSSDSGRTWNLVANTRPADIAIWNTATDGKDLYIQLEGYRLPLAGSGWISEDRGASWRMLYASGGCCPPHRFFGTNNAEVLSLQHHYSASGEGIDIGKSVVRYRNGTPAPLPSSSYIAWKCHAFENFAEGEEHYFFLCSTRNRSEIHLVISDKDLEFHQVVPTPLTRYPVLLASEGTRVFLHDHSNGFLYSRDFGQTWIGMNPGFPTTATPAFLKTEGGHLFAGTNGGLWKWPLDSLQPVSAFSPPFPAKDRLSIRRLGDDRIFTFSLPSLAYAKLEVYSLSGKLEATVAAGVRKAGSQEVAWNPKGLRGVFLVRLRAGLIRENRKIYLE